uniref:Uncharacterized protein n=1 Tax=Peronospora matthiolae TaxID=2874970 RepID=A0AAV1U5B6_9STRA
MDRRRHRHSSRSESYSPPPPSRQLRSADADGAVAVSVAVQSQQKPQRRQSPVSRCGPKRTNERFGRDHSVSPQQLPPRGTYRGRKREDTGHSRARGTSRRSRSRSIHGHAASRGRDGDRRTSSSHRRSSETRRRHEETSRDRSWTRSPSQQRRSLVAVIRAPGNTAVVVAVQAQETAVTVDNDVC